MRPPVETLPRSLQTVATNVGLEYSPHMEGGAGAYPIACGSAPIFKDPVTEIANLPLQLNFTREVLDMDKPEDAMEYNRVMTYSQAGYGMRIIYHCRQFIKKVQTKNGKKKCRVIQRIYLEYYAPYRVLPNNG